MRDRGNVHFRPLRHAVETRAVRVSYAWNVLELDARDIALHFGHQDGGELVRKLYGHADARLARERVQ